MSKVDKSRGKVEGSGRKKGTPNKKTQDLLAKCEARGLDVFDAMLELVLQTGEPLDRFTMLKEIAAYLYPKRKAVEIELPDVPEADFIAEVERRIGEKTK